MQYLPCFISVRYFIGTNIFPDVLLNDIAGLTDGNSLLLSLKLSVDVLVCVNGEFNISVPFIFKILLCFA